MSFMNGISDEEQESLNIFVETLTGATFEVKVSPQDRVKSIKSKIQKVEGIPVSQQHLLYNSAELQDSSCVTEPSVALYDGAKVKLVLSMRGGPISLVHQAFPLNKSVLKNLFSSNRECLLEDGPTGNKMTILVLRVGDQLNLLHVMEDTEDSSDFLSNGKDSLPIDVLEGESSKSLEENSITMEKVCELKQRMEKLSLQRKSMKADFQKSETNSKTSFMNVLQPNKSNCILKLPAISQQVPSEIFKSRSEFSQVPVLPDIVPDSFKNASRSLECKRLDEKTVPSQICDQLRPKTCPVSVRESEFYDVFSEDAIQNPLHIAQPHFRSCISACSSKLHHEWGGRKTFLQSLNVLPSIASLSDVLSNEKKSLNNQKKSSHMNTVPSRVDKLKLNHRNLNSSLKFKENLRKESQSTIIEEDSVFHHTSFNYSRPVGLDPDLSNPHELLLKRSNSSTSLVSLTKPYREIIDKKQNNNLVESAIKKKSHPRCSQCKKRLSLTSTFECRCGLSFCSYHRYSETHHCTYDFKKESQKMLEQANPSVVAPKLPKI